MIKVCELCGKEFETNYLTKRTCNDIHYRMCIVCGTEFVVPKGQLDKQTCSKACKNARISARNSSEEVRAKTVATNLAKFGTATPGASEQVKAEIKKRTLEKYGVEHTSQLESTQAKRRATTLQKYGVEYLWQAPERKAEAVATMQERYGVDNPGQSKEIREKVKQTNLQKFGVENAMQNPAIRAKAAETLRANRGITDTSVTNPGQLAEVRQAVEHTCMERYGVPTPFQADEVKAKIHATNLQRYGTTAPIQNPDVQAKLARIVRDRYGGFTFASDVLMEKVKQTSLKLYGVEYPCASEQSLQKKRETLQRKYGVDSAFQADEVKAAISATIQEKYGVPWACMVPEFRPHNIISKVNLAFSDMLTHYDIDHTMEKHIGNRSFDFAVTGTNLLVELNPTVTHNSYMSVFDKESSGRHRTYHKEKSQLAKDNGYHCIHIFDWDDSNKLMSLLKPRTPVYARKCSVVKVDTATANLFCDLYHIQGKCKGQVANYGIYYDGELIELMTFGKPRYTKKYQWELLRLCTKTGVSVVGGASRLFKRFVAEYQPESIISYCDLAKFNGTVYEKIGMRLRVVHEPSKIWSKDDKRVTDNLLRQRGYDQLFKADYGKGTSNEELMLQNGWLPVYDCGQAVYEWVKG